MAEATAPRRAALEVLRSVRAGDLLDRALGRVVETLAPRDRAWVHEAAYGTVRLRGRIDFYLQELVRGGTESLDADVLDVLRLGAYQLQEMGSVPPYAAISQSVELARAAGAGRASGLVNGVLQALRRRGAQVRFPDPEREPVHHLATWGSHPQWLVERWVSHFGLTAARDLVDADNRRPDLYVRVVGISRGEAVERLSAAGLGSEVVPFSPNSLRIVPPAAAREVLDVVPAVVQDPAASLVSDYAAVPDGAVALDVCAAPGGKAVGLSTRARYVVAADVSYGRLLRLRENVARLDLQPAVGLVVADARQAPFRPADFVLLDAPCTGTGTLRRHPDGRWRISPADLDALVELQRQLLTAAVTLVRPGGVLVYSTCSLEPEENEQQVEWLLGMRPDFVRDDGTGDAPDSTIDPEGWLRVYPQQHGVDGSFAARVRRVR